MQRPLPCHVKRHSPTTRLQGAFVLGKAKCRLSFSTCQLSLTLLQTLGNSDVNNPPDAIAFDRHAKRTRLNSSSKNEIHVHNHFDSIKFGGSVLGNQGTISAKLDASSSFVQSPPPSSSVPTSPASFLNSERTSSFPAPVDLQEVSIGDLVCDLDQSYSTSGYSAMLSALTEAGIKTAKGLTSRNVNDIVMYVDGFASGKCRGPSRVFNPGSRFGPQWRQGGYSAPSR